MLLPKDVEKVVNHFASLPGIGSKTASRLALSLLKADRLVVEDFAKSLVNLKNNISVCLEALGHESRLHPPAPVARLAAGVGDGDDADREAVHHEAARAVGGHRLNGPEFRQ